MKLMSKLRYQLCLVPMSDKGSSIKNVCRGGWSSADMGGGDGPCGRQQVSTSLLFQYVCGLSLSINCYSSCMFCATEYYGLALISLLISLISLAPRVRLVTGSTYHTT